MQWRPFSIASQLRAEEFTLLHAQRCAVPKTPRGALAYRYAWFGLVKLALVGGPEEHGNVSQPHASRRFNFGQLTRDHRGIGAGRKCERQFGELASLVGTYTHGRFAEGHTKRTPRAVEFGVLEGSEME